MRYGWRTSGAALILTMAMLSTERAAADDVQTCAKGSGDVAITACSRAIATGRLSAHDLAVIYDNRAVEYEKKGDLERAIADYNEAIQRDPKYAVPYNGRGNVWSDNGDLERAIADYTEAIRLDSEYATAYRNRARTWIQKDDADNSIADFDQAIKLNPKDAEAFFGRGRTYLGSGALPKALADLDQASELKPKDAYIALWLDIAGARSNLSSRLAEAATHVDMTNWPGAVIRLYLGQLTPEAVLAAADDPNPEIKRGQVCEANFYGGELALINDGGGDAVRLLKLAASDCPKTFIEYDGAIAELKLLGERP
jgi:lipoprotein NlpI